MKLFRLPILLLMALPLHAAAFYLHSGEYFVGSIVAEQAEHLEVEFAGERYLIPHAAIQRIDRERSVPLLWHVFRLHDGSTIRGPVAREDRTAFTVYTGNGFEIIRRETISDISYEPEVMQAPPVAFRKARYNRASHFGMAVERYTLLTTERYAHPTAYGVSLHFEPYFLVWPELSLGLQASYLESNGRNALGMAGAFMSVTYRPRILDVAYARLGMGAMHVAYQGRSGSNPGAYLALGYSPRLKGHLEIMAGIKALSVYEQGRPTSMAGLEFMVAYRL